MALSPEDKVWIADCIKGKPPCSCGITTEDQQQMGHLIGMLRDSGKGDLSHGIEILRDILKTAGRWKKSIDRIGGAMLVVIGTGICVMIWKGFTIVVETIKK